VLAACIVACGSGAAGAQRFEAVLDELEPPATWDLAHTEVLAEDAVRGCIRLANPNCPSVTRYYLVTPQPGDAYGEVLELVTAAGFTIEAETRPACDPPPPGPVCRFVASRDDAILAVSIFRRGVDAANLGIAEADRSIVLVTARRNDR
jgi:hypothetical protein